jgi:acetoacetyl-CoA reductase
MGRFALVTGGATGIGAVTSKALKAAGYTVAVTNIVIDEATQKFEQETGIKAYAWDVADFDQCAKGVEKVTADFGTNVEILINNAGIARDGMMHKMTVDAWNKVLTTDLFSVFNMSHAVITPMREKKFGRIVSISSINGLQGQMGQTNYSAAKAGIIGFTKALAKESASKGITVNAVAPGYINTSMMAAIPPDVLAGIIKEIPVGRLGEPEDIARAIRFLVADESSFITGETLSVNGGAYMQ